MYRRLGLCGVCGVYLIANKVNGKRYVGSSNDVGRRISQHFTTAARRYYKTNPMYKEFIEQGRDEFDVVLLERCTPETKLEAELKWYNAIQPEYNLIPPDDHPLLHNEVVERQRKSMESQDFKDKVKSYHQKPEYRKKCHDAHKSKMVRCVGTSMRGDTPVFESLGDAARWLNRDSALCCVVSNIRESIDSETRTAYGYKWEVV